MLVPKWIISRASACPVSAWTTLEQHCWFGRPVDPGPASGIIYSPLDGRIGWITSNGEACFDGRWSVECGSDGAPWPLQLIVATSDGHFILERGVGQTSNRRRTDRRILSAGDMMINLHDNLKWELLRPVTTLAVTAIGYLGGSKRIIPTSTLRG